MAPCWSVDIFSFLVPELLSNSLPPHTVWFPPPLANVKSETEMFSLSPSPPSEVVSIVCEWRPPCHGQTCQHLSSPRGAGGHPDAGVHSGGSPEEGLWLDGWPQNREDVHQWWCWEQKWGGRCCWSRVKKTVFSCPFRVSSLYCITNTYILSLIYWI